MKKLVIFGCQQIAVDFIKYVKDQSNVTISLIVTYELPLDKTYGYESVIENFKDSDIEVLSPRRVTTGFMSLENLSEISSTQNIWKFKNRSDRCLRLSRS